MGGEIVIKKKLTKAVIDRLKKLNMTLEIMVDCSHSIHVETNRPDRPEKSIITKPIELDTTLRKGANFNGDAALAGLKARKDLQMNSVEAALYDACVSGRQEGTPSRIHELETKALKIEFPNFDNTIINLNIATGDLKNAITACRAEDAAAFDALPEETRRCMGMYTRKSATNFVNNKGREPLPRTAKAE